MAFGVLSLTPLYFTDLYNYSPDLNGYYQSSNFAAGAVGLLLGDELTLSPIQHLRPYIRAREGRQPWMLHEWQCGPPCPASRPLWRLTASLVVRPART